MEDYFFKAKSGNRSAVKGIYTSSVASAYDSVCALIKDEQKACAVIKEAYYFAFSKANSETEFYEILNYKAGSDCKFYSGEGIKMAKIVPINTYYADLSSLSIPEDLKTYAAALSEIVALCETEPESEKSEEKTTENKDFQEFSEFSITKSKKPTAEDKLSEIINKKTEFTSTEEKIIERKEKRKDKTHLIISLVCAAVIIAGAVSGIIIARRSGKDIVSKTTSKIYTEKTTAKIYAENEGNTAFKDYLNNVIIPRNGRATSEKTVAYNESGAVGLNYLNGVVSAKIFDFDKDGEDELAVILLSSYQTGKGTSASFIYDLNMSLYNFEDGKVVPDFENYFLMEYKTDNRTDDYSNNNFKYFVRLFYKKNIPYIYTQASGTDYSMVSYSSYYGEKMHGGQTFLYYAFNEESFVNLKKSADGTYEPIYFVYRNYPLSDASKSGTDYISELKNAGFNLSTNQVKCTSSEKFKALFNSDFAETGLSLGMSAELNFATEKQKDYLVLLNSSLEKVGDFEWKTIVSVKDFTELNKLANK